MYFSSEEYTKPDIVVIYDIVLEMGYQTDENNIIHSEISFSNMIHSSDTVLVITDNSEDQLKLRLNYVNAVQPVKQLVHTEENPYSCSMCQESFAFERDFKKHMKTYHQRGGEDNFIHTKKNLKVRTSISNNEKKSDTEESTFMLQVILYILNVIYVQEDTKMTLV